MSFRTPEDGPDRPGEYHADRYVSAETLWTTDEFDPTAKADPLKPNPRRVIRCKAPGCNYPVDVPYHDIPRVEAGEIQHCSMCREEMAA